jgi:hypothetical protein
MIQDTESYLKTHTNYIHGSAMFRKVCFKEVGGYKHIYPEDNYFWKSIIALGYSVTKLDFPYLYYRQHSPLQANNALSDRLNIRQNLIKINELYSNLRIISNQNEEHRNEINNLKSLNVLNLKLKTLIKIIIVRLYNKIKNTLGNK